MEVLINKKSKNTNKPIETFNWQGYKWTYGDSGWEIIHPKKAYCWHDKSCVEVVNDELILHAKHNPKYFDFRYDDGEIFYKGTSPVGVGWVQSKPFTYGYFEVYCKMPKGDNMWPAVWMFEVGHWPPEIDIIEGYSSEKGSYWRWGIPWWDVQTNMFFNNHVYTEEFKEYTSHIKGKAHNITWCKRPENHYFKYAVDWQENYVKFYYNDRLVRTIDNSTKILNKHTGKKEYVLLTFKNAKMKFIINNHINSGTNTDNFKEITPFKIKSFTYRKYK